MVLSILRGVFILLAAAVTILYVLPFQKDQDVEFDKVVLMITLTLGVTAVIIAADVLTPRKKLSALSGVFLGLIGGLLAAYALSFVVDLIGVLAAPKSEVDRNAFLNLLEGVKVLIGLITCYVGISLVLQTKDDFRFVLPYVEFAKQIRGPRPTVLDTSVLVDGRIMDISETQIIQGLLVVPKFVLNEMQTIADSADKIRRARGRRALDILQKLQNSPLVDVVIEDADADGTTVDQKLVGLSQDMRARLMTNDFNLAKVARLRGVDVININDLSNALRPIVLPGETMTVKIIKAGEGAGQGVGYLEDGTMVVVENARQLTGQEVNLTVTSMLQTSAGRMIFGRHDGDNTAEHPPRPTEPPAATASPTTAPAASPQPSDADDTAATRTTRPTHHGSSGRNPRRSH